MTRETKPAYPINAKSPSSKEDSAFEQFGKKNSADSKANGLSEISDSAFISDKKALLNGRESHSQREAVIRPQQAGRIDFKSLQNRSKFSSDATWTNGKSSPLFPTGKSKGKDKSKRSGKGDRNQHQLYRLSISSSRSNPTIGIAYPQQKVTPPKKLEVSQGPISGNYHFNVSSLPDREGEVHQEERNFNRSHPEPSPSLTSTSYTSQTAPASRIHQSLKIQPSNLHDTANSSGQLHYLEFQPNGNTWHPPDKHFTGTSGYVISNQKVCSFPEVNKSDYGPVSFQYPFPSLQEQVGNTFCNNGSNQDFVDAALAANQVAHSTYSFQSSSREGPEDPQGSGSYNTVLPDNRTYGIPSQQAPFLHTQQGVQHSPTPPCYTGRNDHVTDHNGAISSTGAFSSSGAIEQTQSTFQENQSVFNPSEYSLHSNSMPALINKRQQPSKDFVHSQRLLTPGSTLRRNIPQTSLNKVHFPGKVYSSVNTGSVPFDKNLARIPQAWDGGNNNFPTLDQNSVSYPNASVNVIPYPCQPNEQRQVLKNQRMPWQQSLNAPSTTNHNRIELSRHIGSQKPYPLSNPEWQNNNLMTKIPPSYHTKKHLVVEGSPTQRADMTRQNYSSNNDILYDNIKDTNDTRTKSISYGVSQPIQQSRNNPNQPLPLSGKPFITESPYESPLPSPVTNPVSGSTCSSLSPMSSSPVNADENQVPHTLTSSPYFHQPCHPSEKSFNNVSDSVSSSSFLYSNSEPTKTYNYIAEPSKDEHAFKNLQDNRYQKIANEPNKGCLENFESEPPPPYSSHHFLASSLSSANLDQLDILLTCKQCDQNFGNLSSFLEHRQYCHLNSTVQTEMKDSLHGGDVRKSVVDPLKSSQTLPGISLPKAQTEFHSHLTAFSKDYLLYGDAKAEAKEDPMKGNISHTLPHLMPLTACDTLEMDDAKLDSLIIEALNGLEFQVDNPEIDSTFIDVFVDDDLTTAKACSHSQKVKENKEAKKRSSVEQRQAHHNSIPYTFEEKYDTDGSQLQRNSIQMQNVQKCTRIESAHKHARDTEPTNTSITKTNLEDCEWQQSDSINKGTSAQEKRKTAVNKTNFNYIEGRDIKCYESQPGRIVKNDSQDLAITETAKSRRAGLKDAKKKKAHNGTWSKELIHKIVQQKNKLHKLHVKSNKNVQFSLVTERLFPSTKTHTFGEYDYISDSDDERATSLPQNVPNSRLKYNFNRDMQGRGTGTKVKEPIWRMGEATRFQLQSKDLRSTNKETSNRIRRRNSQSSNSSDRSTSISSETVSSPKSTERTDSENEPECEQGCKSFSTQGNAERNLIKPLVRENPPETMMHTEFSKATKRFGSAKFLLANSKVYQKMNDNERHSENVKKLQQTTDSTKKDTSKTHAVQSLQNGEQDSLSTYQEAMATSTLSQDNYTSKLMVNIGALPQQHSSFDDTNTNYQEKQLESIECDMNPAFCDDSVKYLNEDMCNGSKDFSISVPCYNGDSSAPIPPQESDKTYGGESQQYPHSKEVHHLYRNTIFTKSQNCASTDIEQIYANQNNTNNLHSFENKCSELAPYPSDSNENKVSAGLSFDSASIFAALPISDFESPLYNDVTASKDNYVEFNQSGKTNNFEQQFPEFLQEKNWDLIGEISMSADNGSPFPVQESQATDKYVEHIPVSSEQMTTLSDYNVGFINISEDELEIKRLVTELESQLQTSKVHNDTSLKALPKNQMNQELSDPTLTLREMAVNPIESCRNNAYFDEIPDNVHNSKRATSPLQDSQPLVKVDRSCENLRNSWACQVQFDSFTSDIQCCKQTSMLNDARKAEGLGSLGNDHSPSTDMSDECLSNLSNQIECPRFPDHDHLKNTLVPSEEQLSKNNENNGIHEQERQQNDTKNLADNEEKAEERYDDPPELEPVQNVTEMVSEFALHTDGTPLLNISDTPMHKSSAPEEQLLSTGSEAAADTQHLILHNNEGLQDDDNQKDFVLLDMPILIKEENAISEKALISKESSENPLQQLQLFVARTAKNNEEDMLIPCFPMLLAASTVSDPKTEAENHVLCNLESAFTSIEESEENAQVVEHKGGLHLSEPCTQQIDAGSNCCTFLKSLSNDAQCKDKQANSKERSELSALNDGLRNDPGSLQSEKLSPVQVENHVRGYGEIDGKKSSSLTKKGKPASTSAVIDNEAHTGSKITATLIDAENISEADCLESGTSEPKKPPISKMYDDGTRVLNSEFSLFRIPENNQQHVDILQETELFLGTDNTQETPLLSGDKCDATTTGDKSSTHISLPPHTNEALCNSNNDYETHLLSLPTACSVLSFDVLSHESLKESISPQKLLYAASDDRVERDALCKNSGNCQNEQELAKHSVGDMDVQLYLHKHKTMTLENSQKLVEEKVLVEPVVERSITPCFCSELVCVHYKSQQEPVTDLILGCQSIPTNDHYPVYTGENTNYLSLQNDIFPESMQTPVEPPMCTGQEETSKCDWNTIHDGSSMEHVFPNKEGRSSATVCDLIADQGFVEFKSTEETSVQLVPGLHNTDVEKKISSEESENRCTNDMHSVIDGVLRILEGDRSKEILQSIGISPKISPIKEKKCVGLSLTCDICSVSFRSKPGLMRHKAVKHNGSLATQKDSAISVKHLKVKNAACEWNNNNDSQHNLDTTSQNIISELLNPDGNLSSQILLPDEEIPLTAKNTEDVACDPVSKNKLNGKVKKRKRKSSNKPIDSQIPSDDVLNILKTNILKAIEQSNSFNSSEPGLEQALNNVEAHTAIVSKNESIETYSTAVTIDDDEKLVSDVLDMEMNGESLLPEQTWAKNLNRQNEHINDCKIQPVETMPANDRGLLTAQKEHSVETAQVQKEVQVSDTSKETVTDFHIFFDDDDNTFSQLFPRDDHFIRRKCTRVYGKRNKRQTPPFESDFKHTDIAEQCHTPQINYSSDYGNISLESTLDSSHFSNPNEQLAHYEHLSPSKETSEGDKSKILSFVCQNQESMNVPSFFDKIESEKGRDVSPHITLYKPSAESSDLSVEMSPDTRNSQTEDILSCNASDDMCLPEVPTIDMKMLSTKFDMRELSFFSACGEDSEQSELETSDITQMPEKRKKNSKNKLNSKSQARNHNNTKMKNKDKQYKCKVCFQWFLTLGELDFHKLTHNPSPPPTCYMCVQRKFSSREQLRDHLKEKHAKNKAGLWICGMCLKEISDVWMYNEHLREHATQFARKGQAQKSVMGIPGCFGGDSMVRTFLSTFIYRTPSTLSKTLEADDKGLSNNQHDQKEHKGEEETISEKEPENFIHVVAPAPTQRVKLTVSPSMDNSQKSDVPSRNATMHPHCKDPSRDCHHCGKQFPKPFKLQRHLVVHSLQKIYLCHKCPKSYEEAQELRNHLNDEHQLAEKSEIKHTTLYACELCADVMHVIKKSFICSTCNYTFSKKEQYDRHMEKHLIGGSMTFKFRGVTRPTISGKELKLKIKDSPAYDNMPPPKKLKTLKTSTTYSHASGDVTTIDHSDLSQCPRLSPSVIFDEMMEENMGKANGSTVKIEEIMMDAPELQAEGKEEQSQCIIKECPSSPKICDVKISEKESILDTEVTTESPVCEQKNIAFPESIPKYNDITDMLTDDQPACKVVKPTHLQTSRIKADNDVAQLLTGQPVQLLTSAKTMPLSNDTLVDLLSHKGVGNDKETVASLLTDGNKALPTNEKSLMNDIETSVKSLKKNKSASQLTETSVTESHSEEFTKIFTPKLKQVYSLSRDNGACNLKETNASQMKAAKKDQSVNLSKNNTDMKMMDKTSGAMCQKPNQRKRKEHKMSVHKGNAASQENLVEVKKKKCKLVTTGKSESSVNVKKSEWISGLLDTKDETPGIRPHPKPHTGAIGGQFKKSVLDTHNQKKVNSQSINGEYKSKRTAVTKSNHQFSSKSSALSINNPSHKRKMGHNTKPTEPSNYRTAESQNNLLSQLFGQKLTSFKIPLRRDVTE